MQNLQMDFFNYAGIHRPVLLYTLPKTYVKDIVVQTTFTGSTGIRHAIVDAFPSLLIVSSASTCICFLFQVL